MTRLLLALCLLCAGSVAQAARCANERFEGQRFTWCLVDLPQEELRVFLNDATGRPYGSFRRLDAALNAQGLSLGVAMNGGMYHQDRAPVGYYVENGQELAPIVTREGPGNFGLLPNGVLCIQGKTAEIVESRAFARRGQGCAFATQSGPMLVIDGALHPRFIPGGTSLNIRNGVGLRANGREVLMVIANDAVNFDRFARFFRDVLKTPNALFLDGTVSKIYAPELGRNDVGLPMGPILGTVRPNG